MWERTLTLLDVELARCERKKEPPAIQFVRQLEVATNQIAKLTVDPNKTTGGRGDDDPQENDSGDALATIKIRSDALQSKTRRQKRA